MKLELLASVVLFLTLLSPSSSIRYNFEAYINAWEVLDPPPKIVDLSHLANPEELCGNFVKPFNIFIKEDQMLVQQQNRNKTVLIVGGLKGTDFLGPTAMLNLYRDVRAGKVIFFPVPNPSGFVHQVVETYPPGVDIEQDFPMLGRTDCFSTSAVRILDYLFKTYLIDLTIYLHEGPAGVDYSWSKKDAKPIFQLSQAPLYKWIADNLNKKYQQVQMTYLTEGQTVSSLEVNQQPNNFVDWAYGASKYPEILAPVCGNMTVERYPQYAMNGLAVSLSFGLQDEATYDDGRWEKRVIERGVEMTKWLVSLVNPRIEMRFYQNSIFEARLEGCRTAFISVLRVFNSAYDLVGQVPIGTSIKGSVGWVDLGSIKIPSEIRIPLNGNFQIEFLGDPSDVGVGDTFFSRYRQYTSQNSFQILPVKLNSPRPQYSQPSKSQVQLLAISKSQSKDKLDAQETPKLIPLPEEKPQNITPPQSQIPPVKVSEQELVSVIPEKEVLGTAKVEPEVQEEELSFIDLLKIGGLAIVGVFAVCFLVNCVRVGAAVFRSRGKLDFKQKFQKVEYVQSTEEDIGLDHRIEEHKDSLESTYLSKE